jgi:hypothetical protein
MKDCSPDFTDMVAFTMRAPDLAAGNQPCPQDTKLVVTSQLAK